MPEVSVIVVNYNGRHMLPDCLESLREQTYRDFEVILVDNGSSDGSADWVLENWPDVKLVELDINLGFTGGNNRGIRESSGKYIALLNNDTQVDPHWLEELHKVISISEEVAACDSKVLFFDDRELVWSAGAEYTIAGSVQQRGFRQRDGEGFAGGPCEVFTAVACAAMYRRDAWDAVGDFDEDLFNSYEDVDWSFRARLMGYRLLNVPSAIVYHKVSATQIVNSFDFVRNGQRNVSMVFLKNMPMWPLVRFMPLHLIYTVGSYLYFRRIGMAGAWWAAKKEFLLGIGGTLAKRRSVQKSRRVSNVELTSAMTSNWLRSKIAKMKEA